MSSPAFTYQERSTTSGSFTSSNLYNLILPSPSHSSLPRSLCSRRPAKWSEVLMNEWPGLLTDFINKLRACRSELENFRALSVGRTPSKERLASRTDYCTHRHVHQGVEWREGGCWEVPGSTICNTCYEPEVRCYPPFLLPSVRSPHSRTKPSVPAGVDWRGQDLDIITWPLSSPLLYYTTTTSFRSIVTLR